MKIGILIPDRGDRPKFMLNCWRMLNRQIDTLHKLNHEVTIFQVGEARLAPSEKCDISARYRIGYLHLSKIFEVDVIFFIENDDWYAPNYLPEMLASWIAHGKPDLFGTRATIYYHLKLKAWYTTQHEQRSCAMNTVIRANMRFPWPPDHEPFTDIWLWELPRLTKKLWSPPVINSLGMKHGVGKVGGASHIDRLHRYTNLDGDMKWLKAIVDEDSFKFYEQYSKELQ